MPNSRPTVPIPHNEPVLEYRPGSPETNALKAQLKAFAGSQLEIPVLINGQEVRTGKIENCVMPHQHAHVLARYHNAGPAEASAAIAGAMEVWRDWSTWTPESRAAVFLRAGELLATKYRPILNAATMLVQSKTCHQAEIDAACELIDFYRFNVAFQQQLQSMQPESAPGSWNQLEYRPLEGFVFAVTPFNFTSIAGNLPASPALMGNVVLWKPASSTVYSGYFIMKLLEEAGLPPGVIQFLPSRGAALSEVVLGHRDFAGLHFTGSTEVFNNIWETVGRNLRHYRGYPRIVGETGGKDFVVAHASADLDVLSTALLRGAFEYQGQKCSAASRAFVPQSLWPKLRDMLGEGIAQMGMGDISDFRNFLGAVIDRRAYDRIRGYIEEAKQSSDARVVAGGKCSDEVGYFIQPTLIEAVNPKYRSMVEEIFGPVLSVHVYDDARFEDMLKLCDEGSPYALTGAVIAQDRRAVAVAQARLTHTAGNFYINTKPTGAVVGQQPFGGARGSGTNDKAGSLFNLVRWVSLRTISETFAPPRSFRYPFMTE